MSERNPRVSTRRGDDGTTTLLGSGRLSKADARIALLGEIDEASAFIGLARAEAGEGELNELLLGLQRLMYRIMGDVAMPEEPNQVAGADVRALDGRLEELKARTALPREFVVPGETKLGAHLDVARAVVRRAERAAVAAGLPEAHPEALKALNRLSDVLFVAARRADGRYSLSRE
ncbi:cob(I)yrinic acid a,c-diamide adenosyltransferase [Rubrobacter taiwanensis]|jgi:cob(I)alamin adenosyltransferase|uniref:Corrinoid adenosyltransferase n=1 Tax=Rubrobacter taiwanensis TaxID=185139 RepID=A0A4R1BRL8_9ACTN|nr:cob(I)yrinic acid a,c-diamide adenosyltransferase [Rubrobacter taiwanensis]TCJ19956.1 cob(I)yrinic acid a,c-diamide adenosyltransferase [Rubrobacter taiwanensis]